MQEKATGREIPGPNSVWPNGKPVRGWDFTSICSCCEWQQRHIWWRFHILKVLSQSAPTCRRKGSFWGDRAHLVKPWLISHTTMLVWGEGRRNWGKARTEWNDQMKNQPWDHRREKKKKNNAALTLLPSAFGSCDCKWFREQCLKFLQLNRPQLRWTTVSRLRRPTRRTVVQRILRVDCNNTKATTSWIVCPQCPKVVF